MIGDSSQLRDFFRNPVDPSIVGCSLKLCSYRITVFRSYLFSLQGFVFKIIGSNVRLEEEIFFLEMLKLVFFAIIFSHTMYLNGFSCLCENFTILVTLLISTNQQVFLTFWKGLINKNELILATVLHCTVTSVDTVER